MTGLLTGRDLPWSNVGVCRPPIADRCCRRMAREKSVELAKGVIAAEDQLQQNTGPLAAPGEQRPRLFLFRFGLGPAVSGIAFVSSPPRQVPDGGHFRFPSGAMRFQASPGTPPRTCLTGLATSRRTRGIGHQNRMLAAHFHKGVVRRCETQRTS